MHLVLGFCNSPHDETERRPPNQSTRAVLVAPNDIPNMFAKPAVLTREGVETAGMPDAHAGKEGSWNGLDVLRFMRAGYAVGPGDDE